MKSINIVECKNEDDLKEVAILAEKIWHEFFPWNHFRSTN